MKAGYDPVTVEDFDAAKDEVEKLPPGAVIVVAMKFTSGTSQELINWQKREGYKFPVIAIVDNLNPLEDSFRRLPLQDGHHHIRRPQFQPFRA